MINFDSRASISAKPSTYLHKRVIEKMSGNDASILGYRRKFNKRYDDDKCKKKVMITVLYEFPPPFKGNVSISSQDSFAAFYLKETRQTVFNELNDQSEMMKEANRKAQRQVKWKKNKRLGTF